jgi:hypothetical protein
MVAILSRWSEQSGASPCTGGEYSDVPATHPFCGESGWMAAAGISRRYSARTFRPSVVVTRQVALAVPIHPHRMIAGLLVVLPGSRHSSLCQWPSRIARWRPAGTQQWATRSVAINFSGPGRALGFALGDLRCRRAQLAAADRADRRWPRGGGGRFMGHRSGLARNGTFGTVVPRSGRPRRVHLTLASGRRGSSRCGL